MNPLPSDPYIELHVPEAKTEQEFLRLAVQAAVMKYRETYGTINPPQSTCDEASSLQGGRDGVTHLAMAKTRVLGLDHSTLHDTERRQANEGTEAATVTPGGLTISAALETVAYPERVLPEKIRQAD